MKKITIIYSTFPDLEAAQKAGEQLVTDRLLACAVYIPAQSNYIWNNAMHTENEFVMLGKTTRIKLSPAIHKLELLHPYDVPGILTWEVECNDAYAIWVEEQTL
jgi:periplasmic divalent cation tolerance protein